MANKSRVKSRKSKRKALRKRNTRRNKKTGGGVVDEIITDVANYRALTVSPEKIESMQKKFKDILNRFNAHISRIFNVYELESLLSKIDSIRYSGSKGNDIFELAKLETIIDNRIDQIVEPKNNKETNPDCEKINSARDYETAKKYYYNCHGYYPEQYPDFSK